MGQRATLAIRTAQGIELYYSHWRANTLDSDLFWGPAHATAFVRGQRSEAEGAAMLDERWAEGGAVIDHTRRELLWFGGEDILYDVYLRRIHQMLMAQLWPGWKLIWAGGGIANIARNLGFPVEEILIDDHRMAEPTDLDSILSREWMPLWLVTALSVHAGGELYFFQLHDEPTDVLRCGEQLARIPLHNGSREYTFVQTDADSLQGGIHMELEKRTLGFWMPKPFVEVLPRVQGFFPGWSVEWWGDACEEQLARCGSRMHIVPRDVEYYLSHVRDILLRPDRNHSDTIPDMLNALGRADHDVEINSFALRDDPRPLTLEVRTRLLDTAVQASRSGL